ncbi:MAG: substrate-binding domain-containing protein [Propionibacteriaceae bacterium]|jgi:phosphate transport system substrate-binding protein|nr:substrate-binding domain-containing protein [Propionibacteriaceae bacterium]
MKKITIAGIALMLLAGCTPAATTPPADTPTPTPVETATAPVTDPNMPTFTLETLPKIDGSTANIPLASLLVQRLTGCSEVDADAWIEFNSTPVAYSNLASDDPEWRPALLLAYEADSGTAQKLKDSGVEIEKHPIGRDALVFLTNSSNKVDSVTTDQLRDIYSGKIKNWKKVGGADQEIVAYQRPEDSGSQALMRKLIMGDTKMAEAPTDFVTGEMSGLVEGVASYANTGNALGYSVYYYVTSMLAMPDIKLLAVDGVAPNADTIGSGEYPHINQFYAVVRADEPADSAARQIVAWLESDAGKALIAEAGYVGLK